MCICMCVVDDILENKLMELRKIHRDRKLVLTRCYQEALQEYGTDGLHKGYQGYYQGYLELTELYYEVLRDHGTYGLNKSH